jgi:hypothetical protein
MTDTMATNEPPPFLWSQIESADYRQYIANLRAVGCPEQDIRDIIVADVNQAFVPRFTAIWKSEVREYWRKSKREEPNPEQEKQLMALSKDKAAVLRELLGVPLSEQRLVNTAFLQVQGSEQQLLFLPSEKRAVALQALADADLEMKEEELHNRQELYDKKLKALAGVLSPEELQEFRMRNSRTGQMMRVELQYFDCTPEEFTQLFAIKARPAGDEGYNPDLLNRTAATEEVRKLFGDERAKEFERVTDVYYIKAREAAEEQGLPLGRADQAWQVTRDMRTAMSLLAKNTDLPAEEQTRQRQALVQRAEARLIELLGPKAASGVFLEDLRFRYTMPPPP